MGMIRLHVESVLRIARETLLLFIHHLDNERNFRAADDVQLSRTHLLRARAQPNGIAQDATTVSGVYPVDSIHIH